MPTQMHFIPNCHQSGQRRHGSRCVGRCLTRVEPTIKVWSDVHGGSGLNSWFDLNCVGATKITAKPRSRWNLNLVQAWSTLVKRALRVMWSPWPFILGARIVETATVDDKTYLSFNWTDFWYSSLFGIAWLSNLGCSTFGKRILSLMGSWLAVTYGTLFSLLISQYLWMWWRVLAASANPVMMLPIAMRRSVCDSLEWRWCVRCMRETLTLTSVCCWSASCCGPTPAMSRYVCSTVVSPFTEHDC